MARPLSQTLILIRNTTATGGDLRPLRHLVQRRHSTQAKTICIEAEARVVGKIEDAIHDIITKRSKPDWLPFVPGASYWVPHRRSSYGVAKIVNQLANALTHEENLCLNNFQDGLPLLFTFIIMHLLLPITQRASHYLPILAYRRRKKVKRM